MTPQALATRPRAEAAEKPPEAAPDADLRGVRVLVLRHARFPDDPTVRKEVRALVARGAEVDVVCLRGRGEPWRSTDEGARVHRLPLTHRRGGVLRYLGEYVAGFAGMFAAAAWLHLRRRHAVVQVNTMPDALVFAALVPRLRGASVVLHLHEPTPELWLTKFGPHRLRRLHHLQARIEQAAIRWADASLTVSDALRRRYVERGADPARLTVLRNVCDESFAASAPPLPAAREHGGLRLVTHGLVEERCGQATLVEAVRLLADELPGLRLEIVGDGPFRTGLEARVRAAGLAGRVSLTGFVPAEELLRRLRAADVGVVPMLRTPYSELVDTTKMYEYVALGIPVVASRLPVVADTFDDGEVAFFAPGDAAELAARIRELYHDPARRRALAAAATLRYEPMRWREEGKVYAGVIARAAGRVA
jgi:glycosyltransferase involved in cell wall biosynthesis